MKNTLLSLALASTLVLGNGCLRTDKSYTETIGDEEVTYQEKEEIFTSQIWQIIKIKRPNGVTITSKGTIQKGNKIDYLEIEYGEKTEKYSYLDDNGRTTMDAINPLITAYMNAVLNKRKERVINTVQSGAFYTNNYLLEKKQ